METLISYLSSVDWKAFFSGLALVVSLLSFRLSFKNSIREQKLKEAEKRRNENQLISSIDVKLYKAWDLMGGDLETMTIKDVKPRADLNLAKRLIDGCMIEKPDYSSCHYHLGLYYNAYSSLTINDRYIRLSENAFQEATRLEPNNARYHSTLGVSFFEQKRFDEAIVAFQKAISIDSEYEIAYFNLGNGFYNQKRFLEAIEAFQYALHLDPEYLDTYNNLGLAFSDSNQFE